MATQALNVLPRSTFPAPGVAAAMHRAIAAAGADPRPQGVAGRPASVLSLEVVRSAVPRWLRPSPVGRRVEARPSLIH
jgi:hypothetical protein